uniref:Uncharacterized protein n=1 Tax=Odontella aurita TaxID=265563 RepID=A0A7S4IRN2_9STRA
MTEDDPAGGVDVDLGGDKLDIDLHLESVYARRIRSGIERVQRGRTSWGCLLNLGCLKTACVSSSRFSLGVPPKCALVVLFLNLRDIFCARMQGLPRPLRQCLLLLLPPRLGAGDELCCAFPGGSLPHLRAPIEIYRMRRWKYKKTFRRREAVPAE